MTEWRWLSPAIVLAIHERQLAEHGGLEGIRDPGAIDAALSRPRQLADYEQPDVFDLAACYLRGIVRNHGFADGNKRTAWVVARVFLADHGVRLVFDKAAAVRTVESAAAGEMTQSELADWFRGCAVSSLRLQQGP